MIALIKRIYLNYIRYLLFNILFVFTNNLRKKELVLGEIKNIIIFGLYRIGDNVLSIPALKSLRDNFAKSNITIISNRYVKDILEIEGSANKILFFQKENILSKMRTLFYVMTKKWDLAVDLTCDYTFFPALFLFISQAKFKVGYNIKKRGFLFHYPLEWSDAKKHIRERLLDIIRGINLEIKNYEVKLIVPITVKEKAKIFLREREIKDADLLVAIHPGGFSPSQRWPLNRFITIAEGLINKHRAKVLIIDNNEDIVKKALSLTKEGLIPLFNLPLIELIGIISQCQLLICNNSGILHLACALGIPTISTMGPTISWQWWPIGENNIVLKKDLACQPCQKVKCRSHECMELITVGQMQEAIEAQIKRLIGAR